MRVVAILISVPRGALGSDQTLGRVLPFVAKRDMSD